MSKEATMSYVRQANILATRGGRMIIEERTTFIRKHRYNYETKEFVDRRKAREDSLESELVAKSKDAGVQLHDAAVALSTALKNAGPEAAKIAEMACEFARNLWIFELLPSPPAGDPGGSERDEQLHFGTRWALRKFWAVGSNRDHFPSHEVVCSLWCKEKHGDEPTAKEYASFADLKKLYKQYNEDTQARFRAIVVSEYNDALLREWEGKKNPPENVVRLQRVHAAFEKAIAAHSTGADQLIVPPTWEEVKGCWDRENEGRVPLEEEYQAECASRSRREHPTHVERLANAESLRVWSEMKMRSGWSGWGENKDLILPP